MYNKVADIMSLLPAEQSSNLLPKIRQAFVRSGKTVVVFDDDPTGTQTCYDVTVLTAWSVELIAEELAKKPSVLFILTNTRSLSENDAVQLTKEIACNVKLAVSQTKRQIIPISRSDSTLRGHFPAEVHALAHELDLADAVWVLLPVFVEGGRFTIDDIHYIVEHGDLIPVADTPFAKDISFGYSNSNVKKWVEEKTNGKIKASEVNSVSLTDIRSGGAHRVAEKLSHAGPGELILINAVSHRDLEIVAAGLQIRQTIGQKFLFRSSATFVPICAGISPGKIFTPVAAVSQTKNGSLIVVGSYVPKTTSQLNYLLRQNIHERIEIKVEDVLADGNVREQATVTSEKIDRWLSAGKDVVVYTSRFLVVGADSDESLRINAAVSDYIVSIIRQLRVPSSFLVAKGGITSSDLAAKALSSRKAYVLGQAIPGVPVWELADDSKFSKILYIVFPGNVGGDSSLWDVWYRFKYNV